MSEHSSALTIGPRYGRVGVEILLGSHCVAVVGRMAIEKAEAAIAKAEGRS